MDPVAHAVTSALPLVRLLLTAGKLAGGTSHFVGRVRIEAHLADAMTGKRLTAGLDERAGTHALRSLGKWSEVEDAFDLWAQRFAQRLRDLRDRPKPDAN